MRIELTVDLSPARVLSPSHIPVLLQRYLGTPGEIRTLTEPVLSRIPLPVGVREQSGQGWSCTNGVSNVPDLQSGALASRHTYPKQKPPAWKIIQTDGFKASIIYK